MNIYETRHKSLKHTRLHRWYSLPGNRGLSSLSHGSTFICNKSEKFSSPILFLGFYLRENKNEKKDTSWNPRRSHIHRHSKIWLMIVQSSESPKIQVDRSMMIEGWTYFLIVDNDCFLIWPARAKRDEDYHNCVVVDDSMPNILANRSTIQCSEILNEKLSCRLQRWIKTFSYWPMYFRSHFIASVASSNVLK